MYMRKTIVCALLAISLIIGMGTLRPQKAYENLGVNTSAFWSG